MKRLIASTEDLNRNGYRVMTEGIKLENFNANPVLMLFHNGRSFPIGRALDLKKEMIDGKYVLTFMPEFCDIENHADAKLAKEMYEKGWLKSCSIGFEPTSMSHESSLMLPSQLYETVVESELLEISLVPIPGNAHALTLSANCELSKLTKLVNQNQIVMKSVLSQLGLPETASETDVLNAVTGLQNQIQQRDVEGILELGRTKGIVNDKNVEQYRTLGMKDAATLKGIVDATETPVAVAPVVTVAPQGTILGAVVKPAGAAVVAAAVEEATFATLEVSNPKELLRIKTDEPERYKKLMAAYMA